MNGNRMMAGNFREKFNLPATGEGTRHLDPYGEAQEENWAVFKEKRETLPLDEAQRQAVVDGALNLSRSMILGQE